jgi:hypothetical protein
MATDSNSFNIPNNLSESNSFNIPGAGGNSGESNPISVVKPKKKIGGLIQSGLKRVGKTLNNANKIIAATQAGIERKGYIIVERISTDKLLEGLDIEEEKVRKYHQDRLDKNEIGSIEFEEINKQLDEIYFKKREILNKKLENLDKEEELLSKQYDTLLKKSYNDAFGRRLKQRQVEKSSNQDKANRPKPKDIVGVICLAANVVMANVAIGNKKIEGLVDDVNEIISNANTKQDIERAILFRDSAIRVISFNRKRLETLQKIIKVLNLLAPLIAPIVQLLKSNPIPAAVPPGVGVPIGTITTLDEKRQKLQDIIDSSLAIVSVAETLIQKLIDDLDFQESRLNQINNLLDQNLNNLSPQDLRSLLDVSGLGYLKGYDYKGFRFFIKEETNAKIQYVIKGNKHRYAVAVNKDGNEILQSSFSFTLEPDVLVEELKLKIDQKGLVA